MNRVAVVCRGDLLDVRPSKPKKTEEEVFSCYRRLARAVIEEAFFLLIAKPNASHTYRISDLDSDISKRFFLSHKSNLPMWAEAAGLDTDLVRKEAARLVAEGGL